MKSISQGQKSPPLSTTIINPAQVHQHEVLSWLLLKEQFNNQDTEIDIMPEFRMKDNLFTI